MYVYACNFEKEKETKAHFGNLNVKNDCVSANRWPEIPLGKQ